MPGSPLRMRKTQAAATTSTFWSLKAAIKGSAARGSRISPSASAALIRTSRSSSCRAAINAAIARESPIFPNASVALIRTSESLSCRAAIKASIAGVPILSNAAVAPYWTTESSSCRAAINSSAARGSRISPSVSAGPVRTSGPSSYNHWINVFTSCPHPMTAKLNETTNIIVATLRALFKASTFRCLTISSPSHAVGQNATQLRSRTLR